MNGPIPEGRYAEVGDGLRLHYHEVGEQDGAPVVFLHGSGPGASGWSNFMANAQRLAERGCRCLLPDLLGYGYSSKPTDRPYSFEVMGGVMEAFLRELGLEEGRLSFVGNSMGGALAIHLTLANPGRVERLLLMAPGGLEERDVYLEMRGIRRMLRCIYGPEGITADGIRRVFELQVHAMEVSPELLEQRYRIAAEQPVHVFKSLRVPLLVDRLSELACPVLCLWGVEDLFCPVQGAMKVATSVPDCEVVLLSRCGHWVMVERPEVFDARAATFLAPS